MIDSRRLNRESSMELLRIISMFLIVLHHFAVHGSFSFDGMSISRAWWLLITMGGKFGVDIFVLISGYFLVLDRNVTINFKRILKFCGQTFFYSVVIYALFCIFGNVTFDFKSFFRTLFPLTFEKWWFASTYFVLYLIHPFLNILIEAIDKTIYKRLIVLTVCCWCVIPAITGVSFQGNHLIWFVTLYFVAGYIRKFGIFPEGNFRKYMTWWLLIAVAQFSLSIAIAVLGQNYRIISNVAERFCAPNSIFTFLSACFFFSAFTKVDIGSKPIINIVAACSFGVYLISDNELIRNLIWQNNTALQGSIMIIPYSIVYVFILYLICSVLDLFRMVTVEKIYVRLLDNYLKVI